MKFQCIVHQTYRDDVQCPIKKVTWLHNTELRDNIWDMAGNWEMFDLIFDLTGELENKDTMLSNPILHLHHSHQKEHASGLTISI